MPSAPIRPYFLLKAVVVLLIAQLVSCATAPESWQRYTNVRYGYSLSCPGSLVAEPEADNGDGRKFHSRDGQFTVTVYGQSRSADETLLARWKEETREDPKAIKLKTLTKDSFTIARTGAGACTYVRRYFGKSTWINVEFSYPPNAADHYLPMIKAILDKFEHLHAGLADI